MNEELVSNLEDLGLSEKEARVYLANLSLGPATVQKIADQAGIKRVTAYVILESLVNLGLASQSNKGKKTFFNAEDPISLKRLLSKKEQELKDQQSNFESVLPDLEKVKSLPKDSPSVKFYDSPEGIKSIIKTFLVAHKDIKDSYGISNLDQLYAFFPEFEDTSGNPDRPKEQIRSNFLYTSTRGPVLKESDKLRNRVSKWVPPDKYPLNGDLTILGNHVVMLSFSGQKPIGITIESQGLADMMMGLFRLVWDEADKYNQ